MSSSPRVGERIGDYVLTGTLPSPPGELAFVGSHVVLPRRVRIVVPARTAIPELQERLASRVIREACLLEALSSSGIPRVFECGRLVADKRPWLAVELVEGANVAERIAALPMPVLEVAALLRDVASILAHAHDRGIVHEAIATTTIVYRRDDKPCVVGWADATLHDSPDSPLRSAKADIHALGCVAYEALTRALPTMSVARRRPGTPLALASLIDRMLARDPAQRPTAAEVRTEAIGVAELFYIPELEPIDVVDVVDVDLVDVDEDFGDLVDAPAMPNRKMAWTPPLGLERTVLQTGTPVGSIWRRRRVSTH